MASEDQVSYGAIRYFEGRGWLVVHYHPPGGQASLPIPLQGGEIVYLDVIAVRGNDVLLMENKAAFDETDIKKLLRVAEDPRAVEAILAEVARRCLERGKARPAAPVLVLAHGYSGKPRRIGHPRVNLVQLDAKGRIEITKALTNPLQE